jgi:hypothetical protein
MSCETYPRMLGPGMPIPTYDLSHDCHCQTVIANGDERYQGHPTTLLMPDGNTVFCVWTIGHGGTCGLLKKSTDRGQTWSELLPVPDEWATFVNCPTIWHLPTAAAPERLAVYVQAPDTREIHVSISEDGAQTWGKMTPCGIVSVMPLTAIRRQPDGRLLGMTNARCPEDSDPFSNMIIQSWSRDNGVTWSKPETVANLTGMKLCEPWIIPSPDGRELACLIRVNNRDYNSMIMFSSDDGETWSEPAELPGSLTGDRHIGRYLPDGRIMVVFRDVAKSSPAYGHFCGWVGTWADLKEGNAGQIRIKLLQHYTNGKAGCFDCGYPGLEVFSDGSVLATTYLRYRPHDAHNSLVCVRLNPAKLEPAASKAQPVLAEQAD